MLQPSDIPAARPRILPDQFDPDPRLQALLDRLISYYPRAIDPELSRTYRLLHNLGNPHLKIPPVVHVAGTNGKGSVLAYIRAICEAATLSCHVTTSPHLVRFNERFVLAGEEMTTPDLLGLFEEVEDINAGQETTSFELMTAASFLAFSRNPADVTLLEVGMGGEFDATNVMPDPAVTVITSIAKDHMKFLGATLDKIAGAKAGIIKENVPCVIGPQTPEAIASGVMDVFLQKAEEKNAPLFRHGFEWSFDRLPDRFVLHSGPDLFDFPLPNLVGAHQTGNAATAAVAALILGDRIKKNISLSNIERGLTKARWPARLQKLVAGPLLDCLPADLAEGWEIWIDGGHNDGCGVVLADQVRLWADENIRTHLVLGMLNTKDPKDFVKPLSPLVASVKTVTIPDQPLSLSAEDLAASLSDLSPKAVPEKTLAEAVQKSIDGKKGKILITGSLYLMGAVLKDHR